MAAAQPRENLAVALGSSFLGSYCHAGFLNGMAAAGVLPGKISGASAGALAGSLFASGLRGDALAAAVLDPAWRWSFADGGAFVRLPGMICGFWSSGLFSGKRAVKYFRRLLGDVDLSSLGPVKMEIAVTDALRHRPEILRVGPLAELIVASCAVPGLIAVQRMGEARYIDGGVACEAPFEQWLDDASVETIIVHRIRRVSQNRPVRENFHHAIGSMHRTVCAEFHRHRAELARGKGKRLLEMETLTPAPGWLTDKNAADCYAAGLRAGNQAATSL